MKILCLANSYRVGGRCLGGVELDKNHNLILLDGRPKWIRPVCNTSHEEVPTTLVSQILPLDILEFQMVQATGHGHQSENILFKTQTLKQIGRFPLSGLDAITDNNRFSTLFGNRGAAVPEHVLEELDYSLMLLSLDTFETNERIFAGREYPQIKLSFRYKGHLYNLPITDPEFLHRYSLNNDILHNINKIYVSLSLAAPHDKWSSKLVAGIIFDEIKSVSSKAKNILFNSLNDLPF